MRAAVLKHLRNNMGEFVSGGEIARALAISRTAVWKHVCALRDEGYQVESRRRYGYRLIKALPDLLIPEEILAGLTTQFCGRYYHYYPSFISTNDRAKELAQAGAPEGTTVLAEQQSGGRGRLGRNWYSPSGGLWFSVVLRPDLPQIRAPEATFVAAVAGIEALNGESGGRSSEFGPDQHPVSEIGIKWPNDFVWHGKKLGGILTELSGELDRINYLVMGIGLNVNLAPHDFPTLLRHQVTSLQEILGRPVARGGLLRRFLAALEKWYLVWLEEGFGPVREAWKKGNACLDRPLRVSTPEGELSGRAVDIDRDGALLLETAGDIRRIVTGDLLMGEDVHK